MAGAELPFCERCKLESHLVILDLRIQIIKVSLIYPFRLLFHQPDLFHTNHLIHSTAVRILKAFTEEHGVVLWENLVILNNLLKVEKNHSNTVDWVSTQGNITKHFDGNNIHILKSGHNVYIS